MHTVWSPKKKTVKLCSRVTYVFGFTWPTRTFSQNYCGTIRNNLRRCTEHFRFSLEHFSKEYRVRKLPRQIFGPEEFSNFLTNEHQLIRRSSAVRLAYLYILFHLSRKSWCQENWTRCQVKVEFMVWLLPGLICLTGILFFEHQTLLGLQKMARSL